MLSQGVTPPAQAKPDGPQLPNQATKGSVRFMQANLDVIGPEMAMGDPVSAFWFASRCRTSGRTVFPASSNNAGRRLHVRLHRRHECIIGRHPTFTISWCSFPPFIEPRR